MSFSLPPSRFGSGSRRRHRVGDRAPARLGFEPVVRPSRPARPLVSLRFAVYTSLVLLVLGLSHLRLLPLRIPRLVGSGWDEM